MGAQSLICKCSPSNTLFFEILNRHFKSSRHLRMRYLRPYQMFHHLKKLDEFAKKPLCGLDVGNSCVGVALSDEGHWVARPLRTFYQDKDDVQEVIKQLIHEHNLSGLVLGWPTYNMERTTNTSTVSNFTKKLCAMHGFDDFRFTVWGENMTTKNVQLLLKELDYEEGADKSDTDMLAAASILQGYLDFYHCDKSRIKPWSFKLWDPPILPLPSKKKKTS